MRAIIFGTEGEGPPEELVASRLAQAKAAARAYEIIFWPEQVKADKGESGAAALAAMQTAASTR